MLVGKVPGCFHVEGHFTISHLYMKSISDHCLLVSLVVASLHCFMIDNKMWNGPCAVRTMQLLLFMGTRFPLAIKSLVD